MFSNFLVHGLPDFKVRGLTEEKMTICGTLCCKTSIKGIKFVSYSKTTFLNNFIIRTDVYLRVNIKIIYVWKNKTKEPPMSTSCERCVVNWGISRKESFKYWLFFSNLNSKLLDNRNFIDFDPFSKGKTNFFNNLWFLFDHGKTRKSFLHDNHKRP